MCLPVVAPQGDFVQPDSNSGGGARNYGKAIPVVQNYCISGKVLEILGRRFHIPLKLSAIMAD